MEDCLLRTKTCPSPARIPKLLLYFFVRADRCCNILFLADIITSLSVELRIDAQGDQVSAGISRSTECRGQML